MNGDNYTPYFYNYSPNQTHNQSWNNWNFQGTPYLHQNFSRAPPNHSHPPPPPPPTHIRPPPNFHKTQTSNNVNRPYYRNNRNPNPKGNQYPTNGSAGPAPVRYPNPNTYKRSRSDSEQGETHLKTSKKKKKSLSQNVPRRDWTLAEAEVALATEKELNKKSKLSLIIKFPDQELNKEIVTQLNPAIDSVHFQQPCTPRFCYVTLQDSANAEEVIRELNKQKFGNGCIIAEYKRDREEDLVVNAEDIDPLTLYVGNLAQEVTKEDIQKMYPTHKRMDIGFAKKMKFTRYAFVVFKTVKDSLDAFKITHSKELHSKSLIVRFRRLHGTVGMPGEAKLQNAPKNKDDPVDNLSVAVVPSSVPSDKPSPTPSKVSNETDNSSLVDIMEMIPSTSWAIRTPSAGSSTPDTSEVNASAIIKLEPPSSVEEPVSPPLIFRPAKGYEGVDHKPFKNVKLEIKEEELEMETEMEMEMDKKPPPITIKTEVPDEDSFSSENVEIKTEPDNLSDEIDWNNVFHHNEEGEEEENNICMTDFDTLYENMVDRANRINSFYKEK